MTMPSHSLIEPEVEYPDGDGQPMAENTLQFQWIVTIKGNLDAQYRQVHDVFVAGDLLWYPVRGQPTLRRAPDVLVALGRPKGYRGSYRQWEEGGVAPHVVWEIRSPGNDDAEMAEQLRHRDDIGHARHILNERGLIRQQTRCHNGQHGVLRAADGHRPPQGTAAGNQQLVHAGRRHWAIHTRRLPI